jgi:hypothetical protein
MMSHEKEDGVINASYLVLITTLPKKRDCPPEVVCDTQK